jgi:hypothetical protein
MSLSLTATKTTGRGFFSGRRLWLRERRALIRRWRRAMLLPETVLLAALIFGGHYASTYLKLGPGPQQAMAAATSVIQDGVPVATTKRKQRTLQERLRSSPEDVMRLNSADMMVAFGYADLNRRDGGTTVLQFRGADCILDVFLKEDHPVHYEFRARLIAGVDINKDTTGAAIRDRTCVNDILKSRRI